MQTNKPNSAEAEIEKFLSEDMYLDVRAIAPRTGKSSKLVSLDRVTLRLFGRYSCIVAAPKVVVKELRTYFSDLELGYPDPSMEGGN